MSQLLHKNAVHTIEISFNEFSCSSWTSSTKNGDTAVDEIWTQQDIYSTISLRTTWQERSTVQETNSSSKDL